MNTISQLGFTYDIFVKHADGRISQRETKHNLIPTEGLNTILGMVWGGLTVPARCYLALYEGNYVPQPTDTAATLSTNSTETTAYSEATRVAFVPGAASSGTMDNSASPANFTFPTAKVIYGGFMSTLPTKSTNAGAILSAVRFDSPKSLDVGAVLVVTAGFAFTSI